LIIRQYLSGLLIQEPDEPIEIFVAVKIDFYFSLFSLSPDLNPGAELSGEIIRKI